MTDSPKRGGLMLRIALMLLIVLPVTFLLVALIADSSAEDGSLLRRFTTVSVFFMLLGPVIGVLVSLVHSGLEPMLGRRASSSVLLGAVLGGLAVLPLVLEPGRYEGVLFGMFGGAFYALLVRLALKRGRLGASM